MTQSSAQVIAVEHVGLSLNTARVWRAAVVEWFHFVRTQNVAGFPSVCPNLGQDLVVSG